MGMIRIETAGSFGPRTERQFSAMKRGHAQAVAEAIEYLSKEVLPKAIANDHRCHTEAVFPSEGFGDPPVTKAP